MQGGCHRRRAGARHGVHHYSPRSAVSDIVNNAFAHYSFDPRNRKTFGSIGWSDDQAQLEGCLKGAYNTCEAVLPEMRRQAGGRIINISSNLVISPIVPYHDYTAAKGALVGFTRSLAQEAGAWGVTVNAIAAGLTVGTDSSQATTEDMRERIIASTPLGSSPPPRTSPAPWPSSRRRCRVHHGTDPACRRRSGDALTCRIRHAAWE